MVNKIHVVGVLVSCWVCEPAAAQFEALKDGWRRQQAASSRHGQADQHGGQQRTAHRPPFAAPDVTAQLPDGGQQSFLFDWQENVAAMAERPFRPSDFDLDGPQSHIEITRLAAVPDPRAAEAIIGFVRMKLQAQSVDRTEFDTIQAGLEYLGRQYGQFPQVRSDATIRFLETNASNPPNIPQVIDYPTGLDPADAIKRAAALGLSHANVRAGQHQSGVRRSQRTGHSGLRTEEIRAGAHRLHSDIHGHSDGR